MRTMRWSPRTTCGEQCTHDDCGPPVWGDAELPCECRRAGDWSVASPGQVWPYLYCLDCAIREWRSGYHLRGAEVVERGGEPRKKFLKVYETIGEVSGG